MMIAPTSRAAIMWMAGSTSRSATPQTSFCSASIACSSSISETSRININDFLPHREVLDPVALHVESDARLLRRNDRPALGHGHRRIDDVLIPIPLARGDVAGQHEPGQRRQRDVVGAADAGL